MSQTLASRIRRLAAGKTAPFVVAIDGHSGTGKSTLADALAEDLGAAVLHGDDFFSGGVELRYDPPEVLAAECIDWKKQLHALQALRAGSPAAYFPFDWAAFDGQLRSVPVMIEPKPFVLAEGVYSARPELQRHVDFRILLRLPEEERLRRLTAREGHLGAWERQWQKAEDWYFANVSPPAAFDVVIG